MIAEEGHCIWYGAEDDKNIYYDGPAKQLDQDSLNTLLSYCPNMANYGNGKDFCCDAEQINKMAESFEQVGSLLKRCPSCKSNFNQIFCEMNCNPYQSQFIEVNKLKPSKENGKFLIILLFCFP